MPRGNWVALSRWLDKKCNRTVGFETGPSSFERKQRRDGGNVAPEVLSMPGEKSEHERFLSLGHRRRRRPDELCRARRDVLAGDLPRADGARHALVTRRHIERDDAQFPGDGRRRLRLGRHHRPFRRPHRRADRCRAARTGAGAGEPRGVARHLPNHLWRARRPCGKRVLRADDRADHRLVRYASQPCRVAGLGRHGRRADDDLALRALADLGL